MQATPQGGRTRYVQRVKRGRPSDFNLQGTRRGLSEIAGHIDRTHRMARGKDATVDKSPGAHVQCARSSHCAQVSDVLIPRDQRGTGC